MKKARFRACECAAVPCRISDDLTQVLWGALDDMITYEKWNAAIISYFFEESEPDQIVFLQTDAATLEDIALNADFEVEDAAESLADAVRDKIVFDALYDKEVYLSGVDPEGFWVRSQDKPPQVAFLALTVYAASRMEADGDVASTNYYRRLNEVLFSEEVNGKPKGLDLNTFEKCWKHLQRWASDVHDVDLYLTEGPSTRKYVWYPESQCLIRNQERRDIYRFFRRYNLTPASISADGTLKRYFRGWLGSADGSLRLRRYYFARESNESLIFSQVKSLLAHWDPDYDTEPSAGPSPGSGQRDSRINIELRFGESNDAEIRYWFRRRGRERIDCRTNPLGIRELRSYSVDNWFQPVIDNTGAFWELLNPLQLRTDERNPIVYRLGVSDVWVFRQDPERDGGWLSQRRMQLYEEHLIMFRSYLRSKVMACLENSCGSEIEQPSPIYANGTEQEWMYVRGTPVRSESVSDSRLWRLVVVQSKRLSLFGGLAVTDSSGQKAYRDICLPTVAVPDLALSDEPLYINDEPFVVGENRLVPLGTTLKPGFHQVTYGGQTKELQVVSPEPSATHNDRTLVAALSKDRSVLPSYSEEDITGISDRFGVWLAGARFFGLDVPEVTWESVPEPAPLANGELPRLSKAPANIVSVVAKVASAFKQGNRIAPEGFDELIEHLDKNVALRTLVEKKLNVNTKRYLSYTKLRQQVGR